MVCVVLGIAGSEHKSRASSGRLLLAELVDLSADAVSLALLQSLSLETVKVGDVGAGRASSELLGPGSLVEGLDGAGNKLLDETSASTTLHRGSKASERDPTKRHLLTGNTGGGAINNNTLLVKDVHNCHQLTSLRTIGHKSETAGLNETLELHHTLKQSIGDLDERLFSRLAKLRPFHIFLPDKLIIFPPSSLRYTLFLITHIRATTL